MEERCRVTIQPSDDTQTPLHGMKRPAGGVGRGFKHPEARLAGAEEAFVCPGPPARGDPTAVGSVASVLGGCAGQRGIGGGHSVHFPSRLKNEIMNSLFPTRGNKKRTSL